MRILAAVVMISLGSTACRAKTQPEVPRPRAAAKPPAGPPQVDAAPSDEESFAERQARMASEDYAAALATATAVGRTCHADPAAIDVDALLDAYEILAPYERSDARDTAIATLEQCRKLAVEHVQTTLPADGSRRPDSMAQVRRAVDERGRRTTKPLRFVVRGKKVTVDDKPGSARTAREPTKLEGYCALADAPDGAQGQAVAEADEVSCSRSFRFSKQSVYVVQRIGLTEPLSVESTEHRKTPEPAAPPEDGAQR